MAQSLDRQFFILIVHGIILLLYSCEVFMSRELDDVVSYWVQYTVSNIVENVSNNFDTTQSDIDIKCKIKLNPYKCDCS